MMDYRVPMIKPRVDTDRDGRTFQGTFAPFSLAPLKRSWARSEAIALFVS